MRLLFVKEKLSWPRSSGHDVHTFYSMQALARLGHDVGLVTLHELDAQAVDKSGVSQTWCLSSESEQAIDQAGLQLTKYQEKFRSYWGIDKQRILRIGQIADDFMADAVIVVGLNVLPYLGAVRQGLRIWYAGDEWVWHHLSQVKWLKSGTWGEAKAALIKGLYERAYAPILDRVWMVSQSDKKAIGWVAGLKDVDVLPNGVDTEYYHPFEVDQKPKSCVFWGRLDFGPNIQALEWFCNKIWPKVLAKHTDATFTIFGFQPTATVERLAKDHSGIQIIGNSPDIREAIASHQVVVLPFTSGGGIKNKLLEAAALGKAILCTPRTVNELTAGSTVLQANSPNQWVENLTNLWRDADKRKHLGRAAREWVMKAHTWDAVAKSAIEGITASIAKRSPK